MASTVKDAAFVLSAIADTTAENGLQDFASACDAGALRGKRIGVPTDYINLCLKGEIDPSHHTILDRFKRAWGTLKNKGVDLVDNIELPGFGSTEAIKEARGMARLVWICDLREDIEQYLAACGEQVDSNTFAKILEQTKEDANEDYIERGAEWLELSEGGPGLRAQLQYQNIIEKLQRLDTEQGVTAALRRYDLDAIVMPSSKDIKTDIIDRLIANLTNSDHLHCRLVWRLTGYYCTTFRVPSRERNKLEAEWQP